MDLDAMYDEMGDPPSQGDIDAEAVADQFRAAREETDERSENRA